MTRHARGAGRPPVSGGLRGILDAVAAGTLGVDEAEAVLPLLQIEHVGDFARLDVGRGLRKGVPEVIYAVGKTDAALAAITIRFLREVGVALVSRLAGERAPALEAAVRAGAAELGAAGAPRAAGARRAAPSEVPAAAVTVVYDPEAGIFEAVAPGYAGPPPGGAVGLLTAGTSDIPLAEEVALVARHMGCTVHKAYDVGVAGVHRLIEPLTAMIRADVDVYVVVAGMEGALPSVVAGLVDAPVIGVPAPTGYGLGGDGTAALYAMLQSCSPGLLAVNIGNGVGAGAAAGLIARRASRRSIDRDRRSEG